MNILLSPYFVFVLSTILSVLLYIHWKAYKEIGYFVSFLGSVIFSFFYLYIGIFDLDANSSRFWGRWVFTFILSMFITYLVNNFPVGGVWKK